MSYAAFFGGFEDIQASQVTDSGRLPTAGSQTAASPSIRYDDKTLYDECILDKVGRRPRGRPSKAKVEKRRAGPAAAHWQAEFENTKQ
jgi:hypothetical protein